MKLLGRRGSSARSRGMRDTDPIDERNAMELRKRFDRSPWSQVTIAPMHTDGVELLRELTGRNLSQDDIAHVQRVLGWLSDQAPVQPPRASTRHVAEDVGDDEDDLGDFGPPRVARGSRT